jgi:hypothetical protein
MLAPPLSRLPRDGRLWIVTTSRTKSVARRSAPERRTSGGSHQRSKARSQPARHASVPDRSLGLPVLGAPSLCACCRHYAGAAAGRSLRSSHPTVSAFAERVVESACTSSFSRLARRSLALRPAHLRRHQFVTRYTEGFSHFVASMTAPVASGWSGCRVGLAPTGMRRLLRAHTRCGRLRCSRIQAPRPSTAAPKPSRLPRCSSA